MDSRTTPEYSTFGPADGTGRNWHDFFRDVKGRNVDPDPDEPGDDLPESFDQIVITVPAHEVSEGWPSVLTTWRNRLLANGWKVKVGNSVAQHPDTFWKNGSLRKGAHEEQQWWINAAKPGRYVTISYNYENGKSVGNRTVRSIRGIPRLLSDAEMKDAVEADD